MVVVKFPFLNLYRNNLNFMLIQPSLHIDYCMTFSMIKPNTN